MTNTNKNKNFNCDICGKDKGGLYILVNGQGVCSTTCETLAGSVWIPN